MTPDEFDAIPEKARPMPKLTRTAMRSWVARHLSTKQGNLCPVCNKHIDLKVRGEGVADHNHTTGEIRGVLHRSCNAGLGKLDNSIGRWISKSMAYDSIIPALRRVLAYYEAPGAGIVYPMHQSADEKKDARSLKMKTARAAAKAKLTLRSVRKD